MDSTELTWRDKLAIIDVTAKIAAMMILGIVGFCGVWIRVVG